ncbi:tumor necrosis factor-like domain protein [Vibrio phage 1.077.O._10N.261.45.A10]|nr:tumor necrosis factor-like domain protein [Vibrio phage 1.070.O._10N.261.45.B2]AUR85596.1 tumor necrosis factor-like domain protein [Vibrio phage 1.077.O._10N.261.45.A10]
MAIHKDLGDAELHEPKGMLPLVAGAADIGKVVVSKGDGTSEARFLLPAEVDAMAKGTRVVIVDSKDDFPVPAAGTITLADDTTYFVTNSILLGTDTLTMGNLTSVAGIGQYAARINYTGTGAMFNSTQTHYIDGLILEAPNGKFFAHNDSAFSFINYNNLILSDNSGIGTFTSTSNSALFVESVFNDAAAPIAGAGFVMTGNWELFQCTAMQMVQVSGITLDFGSATFNSIGLQGTAIIIASPAATAISGLANSGNLTANSLGKVTNCLIRNPGGGTVISGIVSTDFRWRFLNSTLLEDTRPDALIFMNGNAAATPISGGSGDAGNPIKAIGTFSNERLSHFSFDASGRCTYIGEDPITLPIDISVSAMSVTGTPDAKFYIALNGTAILGSQSFLELQTDPNTTQCIWQITFTQNDYIELFLSNESNTTDITVDTAVLRIN